MTRRNLRCPHSHARSLHTLAERPPPRRTGAVPARFNRRIHVRIKALFSLAALGFAGLALAQATAQNVVVEEKKTETVTVVVKETPKPPAFVFELHGFISTTGFFQDAHFGVGDGAHATASCPRRRQAYDADKPVFGFDIRQTRLNFSVRGPEIMGGATRRPSSSSTSSGRASSAPDRRVRRRLDPPPHPRRLRRAQLGLGQAHPPDRPAEHADHRDHPAVAPRHRLPDDLHGRHRRLAVSRASGAGTPFGDDTKFEFAWSVQRSRLGATAPGSPRRRWTERRRTPPASRPSRPAASVVRQGVRRLALRPLADRGPQRRRRDRRAERATPTYVTVLGTVGVKLNLGPGRPLRAAPGTARTPARSSATSSSSRPPDATRATSSATAPGARSA